MNDAPEKVAVTMAPAAWDLVLVAMDGLHAQLLAMAGPMAEFDRPRSMAAVRAIGDVRWVQYDLRKALGRLEA